MMKVNKLHKKLVDYFHGNRPNNLDDLNCEDEEEFLIGFTM